MKRTNQWIAFFIILFLLAACVPVRPVEQDGIGRELPLRNDLIGSVAQVARPELFETPWDATPDPDGKMIYFTANARPDAGVFRVPAAGGETSPVATGEPLVAPLGLAISTDGERLFVADPEAVSHQGTGHIFVVPLNGEPITMLAGTEGTSPRGLEVKAENGVDFVYFSGNSPADGQPAVWKVASMGGQPAVVAQGAPLVEPVGLAVANDGTVYVADRAASGNGLGSVFRIMDGTVETIADNFRTGTPVVGAALTMDDAVLLVSALAPKRDSAQVLVIELASLQKGIITKVIGANSGSGGVHRAHHQNVFAWADSTRGRPGERQAAGSLDPGGVYRISPDKMEAGAEG